MGKKKLYMASSLEELNKKVVLDLGANASTKRLVRSADTMLAKAEEASSSMHDEELAYIYYMRYFGIVQSIQAQKEYKEKKAYYNSLLKPDVAKMVIEKAAELSDSLRARYKEQFTEELIDRQAVGILSSKESEDIKGRKSKESKKSLLSENSKKKEGFLSCEKLDSLIKEKVSSFLVIDIRPNEHFLESSMKISNLINIPEELLVKSALTADKIRRELEERSRLLWEKRHLYDYIIICDESSDLVPLPQTFIHLLEAMQKWDPGRHYKATPLILDGGFEMFRLMYPMSTTNPRFDPQSRRKAHGHIDEDHSILNFTFPDLDEGFPSDFTKDTESVHNSTPAVPVHSSSATVPSVNRGLKPKPLSGNDDTSLKVKSFSKKKDLSLTPIQLDKDEEQNPKPFLKNSFGPSEDRSKRDSEDRSKRDSEDRCKRDSEVRSKRDSEDRSKRDSEDRSKRDSEVSVEDSSKNKQDSVIDNAGATIEDSRYTKRTVAESVDNTLPIVPSRSSKPKELLESIRMKKKELDEEQRLLDETLKAEQDAVKKLEEVEETRRARQNTLDDGSRMLLVETESQLKTELEKLILHSQETEKKYMAVSSENEELWKLINRLSGLSITEDGPASPSLKDEKDWKVVRAKEEQRKKALSNVDELRKLKNAKLSSLIKNDDNEKAQKRWSAETDSRNGASHFSSEPPWSEEIPSRSRGKGETLTSRLRRSPRTSPVRGGSNLKRSHSALNLAQLNEEPRGLASPITPSFDRSLKPLDRPKKRNVNAARQRNFEPKHGSVHPTKTGLKNLGNTCYMNSIIQCLNNTSLFAKYFVEGHYSEDINLESSQRGDVAEEIGAVLWALWSGQYRSIAMWDLKTAIGRCHKPFMGYDQQDSHEFLIKLMDWLHEDLNVVRTKLPKMEEQNHDTLADHVAARNVMDALQKRDSSVIRNLFYGLHRSVIVCQTCGNRSLTFEPFSVVTVSFPTNGRCTLREMLADYYRETCIEYKCEKCRCLRYCTRKLDIWKLPPYLVIHLNRFEHDVLTKKMQNFVDFPIENLDLSHHASGNSESYIYNLYGVSNHYGTIDGGHYTSYCKSAATLAWYKFDDHEVYDLSRESVRTSAAYILFYQVQLKH